MPQAASESYERWSMCRDHVSATFRAFLNDDAAAKRAGEYHVELMHRGLDQAGVDVATTWAAPSVEPHEALLMMGLYETHARWKLDAGRQNEKWPTSGQNGYATPAVSGIPTASERGNKIRSGAQVGKMATPPLPSRGSQPLRSGGTKSEVAHKWAKWLRHPYRLGDSQHFKAGGQNRKWPTCGQNGYVTAAVSGIPTASERGDKIRSGPLVGNMATSLLPSRGSPPLQSGATKSEVAHKWAKRLRHHCRLGDSQRFSAGEKIRSGPHVGNMATSTLPPRGSPPL